MSWTEVGVVRGPQGEQGVQGPPGPPGTAPTVAIGPAAPPDPSVGQLWLDTEAGGNGDGGVRQVVAASHEQSWFSANASGVSTVNVAPSRAGDMLVLCIAASMIDPAQRPLSTTFITGVSGGGVTQWQRGAVCFTTAGSGGGSHSEFWWGQVTAAGPSVISLTPPAQEQTNLRMRVDQFTAAGSSLEWERVAYTPDGLTHLDTGQVITPPPLAGTGLYYCLITGQQPQAPPPDPQGFTYNQTTTYTASTWRVLGAHVTDPAPPPLTTEADTSWVACAAIFQVTALIEPGGFRVTNDALDGAFTTQIYRQFLGAAGGVTPYSWAIASGSLPPGLTLAGNVIEGRPTTAGTYPLSFTVTDNTGDTRTASLPVTVAPLPAPVWTGVYPGRERTMYPVGPSNVVDVSSTSEMAPPGGGFVDAGSVGTVYRIGPVTYMYAPDGVWRPIEEFPDLGVVPGVLNQWHTPQPYYNSDIHAPRPDQTATSTIYSRKHWKFTTNITNLTGNSVTCYPATQLYNYRQPGETHGPPGPWLIPWWDCTYLVGGATCVMDKGPDIAAAACWDNFFVTAGQPTNPAGGIVNEIMFNFDMSGNYAQIDNSVTTDRYGGIIEFGGHTVNVPDAGPIAIPKTYWVLRVLGGVFLQFNQISEGGATLSNAVSVLDWKEILTWCHANGWLGAQQHMTNYRVGYEIGNTAGHDRDFCYTDVWWHGG